MAKRLKEDISEGVKARVKGGNYDSAAREKQIALRKIEDMRDMLGRALRQAKRQTGVSGKARYSFVGVGKNGIREYISDFPNNMTQSERVAKFKEHIRSVINLGQVQLKTDTKKFVVVADKYTKRKNVGGDSVSTPEGYDAKINSLYDMAVILNSSEFDYKKEEPSYDSSTNAPRTGVEPKNAAHKDVKYWYYFTNTIKLDGVEYDVVFNIRDKGKTQALYFIEFRNKETVSGNNPTAKYSLRSAVRQTPPNNSISQNGGSVKYSISEITSFSEDKYFKRLMDRWQELKHGSYVKVGEIGEGHPLIEAGIPSGVLRYDVDKLKKNMTDHADYLTEDLLKLIPNIIANPIAISEYSKANTVSVFGDIFVGDSPMMVGVTISRDHSGNTISKVRTYNTRRDVGRLINDSSILYLNEDKKRTRKWFQACGIQVPLGGIKFGFIRSISQNGGFVKSKYSIPDESKSSRRVESERLAKENDELRPKAGKLSVGYTPVKKQARSIIGEVCDMLGGGYTKKQLSEYTDKMLSISDRYSAVDSNGVHAVPFSEISDDIAALAADMQEARLENTENAETAKLLKAELKSPIYEGTRITLFSFLLLFPFDSANRTVFFLGVIVYDLFVTLIENE